MKVSQPCYAPSLLLAQVMFDIFAWSGLVGDYSIELEISALLPEGAFVESEDHTRGRSRLIGTLNGC